MKPSIASSRSDRWPNERKSSAFNWLSQARVNRRRRFLESGHARGAQRRMKTSARNADVAGQKARGTVNNLGILKNTAKNGCATRATCFRGCLDTADTSVSRNCNSPHRNRHHRACRGADGERHRDGAGSEAVGNSHADLEHSSYGVLRRASVNQVRREAADRNRYR